MKLLTMFLLLIFTNTARCFFGNRLHLVLNGITELRDEIGKYCTKESDSLDKARHGFKQCVYFVEDTETACSFFTNHHPGCLNEFFDQLENCLPDQAKEVSELFLQSVSSLASQVCREDGEHVLEYFRDCILEPNNHTISCFRSVEEELNAYKIKPPTRNEVCEIAGKMASCFHSHVQDSCSNQVTRESFIRLADAALSPCQSYLSKYNGKIHPQARNVQITKMFPKSGISYVISE